MGTVRSLQEIDADALLAYKQEHLIASRMLLVIVGDISREEVTANVTKSFGKLPPGRYSWVPPPPVERFPHSWSIEDRPLPTAYIQGLILGPRPGEPDYFAFEVATNLLSGRFHSVLRNDLSLTYSAYAQFEGGAVPTAMVFASSGRPDKVYQLLIEQLEWVQTLDRVPRWVLNRYLDQFNVDQLSQNLTADGQALSLGRAELLFGDYMLSDRYLDRIQDVTPSEIRRVAIKYMRDIQMGYLGDRRLITDRMVRDLLDDQSLTSSDFCHSGPPVVHELTVKLWEQLWASLNSEALPSRRFVCWCSCRASDQCALPTVYLPADDPYSQHAP
jgi:zinc protease